MSPGATEGYRGAPFAWRLLVAIGVVNLVRGGIHVFADDSGAARIAGIDLSAGGDVIVMLLAIVGIDQLVWGVVDLVVALRHRAWVAPVLALTIAKQAAGVVVVWLWKPLSVPAPGKYGALATLPILLAGLLLARPRPG